MPPMDSRHFAPGILPFAPENPSVRAGTHIWLLRYNRAMAGMQFGGYRAVPLQGVCDRTGDWVLEFIMGCITEVFCLVKMNRFPVFFSMLYELYAVGTNIR